MSSRVARRRFLALTITVLVAFASNAYESAHAALLAGAAARCIVPPFPARMGGFADRKESFKGVHDEIFARALVLDNGTAAVVLIGSDLTDIDAEMTRQIREKIQAATGIPPAHVLVSCAHNHSAPSMWEPGRVKQVEPKLRDFFVQQFSDAAIEAHKNRAPARAGFRAGELKGATRNRQQGNDLIDPQVGVLRVEARDSRKTIATLFNFTGHPVIVSSNNLLLSGEYPGAASRAVENLLGGVAIFTQGAAGDITVQRSGDPFDEIERIGRTLGGEVIKTSGFIECRDELPLAGVSKMQNFSPREIPSVEDAQRALDDAKKQFDAAEKNTANADFRRQLEQQVRLQAMNLRIAKGRKDGTLKSPDAISAEVQVLQIGDLVVVAIPGEIFVEYALEMRSRVRQAVDKNMVLAGYSNGYIGYITTPRAARTGGYEASVARVGSDAGRSLTETAMGLLSDLSAAAHKSK